MENSRDQDVFVVPIVDDMALDDEGANTLAEFRPVPTHARLFGQELESIEIASRSRSAVVGLASSAT
jgi:hypothetical protein